MDTSGSGNVTPGGGHVAKLVQEFNKKAEESKGVRSVEGEQIHPRKPSKAPSKSIKERTATQVPSQPRINPDAGNVADLQKSYLQTHTERGALLAQKDILKQLNPIQSHLLRPDAPANELPFTIVHVKGGKITSVIPLDKKLPPDSKEASELKVSLMKQLDTIKQHFTPVQIAALESQFAETETKLKALATELGPEQLPEVPHQPRIIVLDVKHLTGASANRDPVTGQAPPGQEGTDNQKGHFELRPKATAPKVPEPALPKPTKQPTPSPQTGENTRPAAPIPPPLPGEPKRATSDAAPRTKKAPPPPVAAKPKQKPSPTSTNPQPAVSPATGQSSATSETATTEKAKQFPEVSSIWLQRSPKESPKVKNVVPKEVNIPAAEGSEYSPIFTSQGEQPGNGSAIASVNAGTQSRAVGGEGNNGEFAGQVAHSGQYQAFHEAVMTEYPDAKGCFFVHQGRNSERALRIKKKMPPNLSYCVAFKPQRKSPKSHEGEIFIDVFKEDSAPNNNPRNRAMVYVVPPKGSEYSSEKDFLKAVRRTAVDLYLTQNTYNRELTISKRADLPQLPILRTCAFSSGIYLDGRSTEGKVAAAIKEGFQQAQDWLKDKGQPNTISEIQYEDGRNKVFSRAVQS